MDKISFLGCGSWGAALGRVLSDKHRKITFWHRNQDIVDKIADSRKHYLLPKINFPSHVNFTNEISDAIKHANIIVLAIPSHAIRKIIHDNKSYFNDDQIIVNIAKGIEVGTLMTVSEVFKDALENDCRRFVTLTGPSHAEEVIRKDPTMLVAGSNDMETAEKIQKTFSTNMLRIYLNEDLKGVELGGSMKNVIAIAAGICDGIGYGDNSKSALITRSMAEITKLGIAMGAKEKTFRGLSGFGDLIVTCLSKYSRNRMLGQSIGEGNSLEKVISKMNMVAEGVHTAKAVHQLRIKYQVEMPIHEAIYQVLFEGSNPKRSVVELMNRRLSGE